MRQTVERLIANLRDEGLSAVVAGTRSCRDVIAADGLSRPYLVTGCGGSGTTALAHFLNQHGIAMSHDFALGRDGIVANACDGEYVSVYDYGRHGEKEHIAMKLSVKEFDKVIHVVRHPLLVIGSVNAKWKSWGGVWRHVREHLDDVEFDTRGWILGAAEYWVRWNRTLASIADSTFRLEDILENSSPFLGEFNVSEPWAHIPQRASSRAVYYPTLADIADLDAKTAEILRNEAAAYGYDLN